MHLDPTSFAAALAHKRGFVVVSADTALLPLRRKSWPTGECALISLEDIDLGRYYWSQSRWGYARRRGKTGKSIFLHREVMGCTEGDGLLVDHISRVRLDNRRGNLRFVTQAQNMQNRVGGTATSAHRGVSWNAESSKWVVNHKINGRQFYGGAFAVEQEAAEAALEWRRQHMPYATD